MQRYIPTKHFLRLLLLLFAAGIFAEVAFMSHAEARAGKGRSFGQRSAPSYTQPAPKQNPSYSQPPAQGSKGTFMKGLAGGLAGGFIGSMLFSSLGHAAGPAGAGGGGIGFLEIVLLAGAGFLLYRLWKSKQASRYQPAFSTGSVAHAPSNFLQENSLSKDPTKSGYFATGWSQSSLTAIDRETAEDLFFRIQAAWMRRDLSLVRDIITDEAGEYLEADIRSLREHGHINHLENISIRQFSIAESWQDGERTFHKVRFTANLLDYTTDEAGRVLEGSDSIPVKFDEYWIFAFRADVRRWQLAGIETI